MRPHRQKTCGRHRRNRRGGIGGRLRHGSGSDRSLVKKGIRGYTDLEQMLKDGAVDVVSICTPSGLHAELAVRAAEAGKHVVVEKPMAMNLDKADRRDRRL